MRKLYVADEVRSLMKPEDLRHLAEGSSTGEAAVCSGCHQDLAHDEPASVVLVEVSPDLTIATVAHPACLPSGIVQPEGPPPTPEQLGQLLAGVETAAYARAGLLPNAAGDRPIIAVELENRMAAAEPGDRVDLVVNGLIEQGLHLLGALGRLPSVAEGWSVRLDGTNALIGRDDYPLYEGPLTTWPQWLRAADQLGGVVLLAGNFRLGEDTVATELRDAARAGLLVGGLVTLRA